MPKHPDTQKRESYVLSKATTALRRKYSGEYLGYLNHARSEGLNENKSTTRARSLIKKAHSEEYQLLRGELRTEWNALFPQLAKQIDERTTNNEELLVSRNTAGKGMRKHLGIPNRLFTPAEAEAIIQENYAWIQKKRRGR